MRYEIRPREGKFRVLTEGSVKFARNVVDIIKKPATLYDTVTFEKVQEDITHPGYYIIPKDTVFTVQVRSGDYIKFRICKTHNEKGHPWAGFEIHVKASDFEDFRLDVDKL